MTGVVMKHENACMHGLVLDTQFLWDQLLCGHGKMDKAPCEGSPAVQNSLLGY